MVYQLEASRTDIQSYDGVYERMGGKKMNQLIHASMGMQTESAEFTDMLKKSIMYNKQLDEVNLAEEMGDLLWYIALGCNALGITMESLMEKNIAKLRARFPDKFTESEANNRNLEVERKILES